MPQGRVLRNLPNTGSEPDARGFTGLIDFTYQHYALGDVLSTEILIAIKAIQAGRNAVDMLVAVNPKRPSALAQGFITPINYLSYVDGIFPAFLCAPMLRSVGVIKDRLSLAYHLARLVAARQPMMPNLSVHLRSRQDYPITHKDINAHFRKYGSIPKLQAPHGFDAWAKRFLAAHCAGRTIVVLNIRQTTLTAAPQVLTRDAPLNAWHSFIDDIAIERPDVLFVLVGGFTEWEYGLQRKRNLLIPRSIGLNLGHELALLANADMFLGTSSGFASFATFSDVPYGIINVEKLFAGPAEISVGDEHYPFAADNQILTWESETAESLRALFDRLSASIELRASAVRSAAPKRSAAL